MRYQDDEEFYNEELEEEQKARTEVKKKRRFRLFNTQREGKGVSKEDAIIPTNLIGFFKRYRRDFSRLLSVNIFYILGNFPLIFALIAISGGFQIPYTTPSSTVYTVMDGIASLGGGSGALNGMLGAFRDANAFTAGTYILLGLSALTLFTFGFVNVGTTYLIRNMLKGDPVFMWSDFWGAIRRNWKQALPFGAFDLFMLCLIPMNAYWMSGQLATGGFGVGILFWGNVVIGLIYVFMRFYIYLQMVTFNLSIRKILKNSLIFVFVGFKRNILALIGILLYVFLDYCMIIAGGFLLPFGIALPLVLLFSNCSYMSAYAAYFKIKELMIDPYYKEHPPVEEREEEPSEENGTEDTPPATSLES